MITLLMAFFIMMYAMSVVDAKKFDDLAFAMSDIFGSGGLGAASGEVAVAGAGLLEGRGLVDGGGGWGPDDGSALENAIRGQVQEALAPPLRDAVQVTRRDDRITVSMRADELIFPRGQATLTPQARQILAHVGAVLSQVDSPLLIEGHTCNLPIHTARFPSNWELSTARASAVMLYLIRRGHISPDRIAAVGYSDTRPLVPNASEASRRRNRRVDIVVLRSDSERLGGGARPARPRQGSVPSQQAGQIVGPKPPPVQLFPPFSLTTGLGTRGARENSE